MKTLGLIVNPIAGMGGAVGLKGTDGAEVLAHAIRLGATPRAPARTIAALDAVKEQLAEVDILTCPALMGEDEAAACGLPATLVGAPEGTPAARPAAGAGASGAEDTRRAARAMLREGVDLLLFAGGDGTARDILAAVGTALPVLGIPAGVKLHSAVFATGPRAAGELAVRVLRGQVAGVREAEVMDIDEAAYRAGRVSTQLFGYLAVPDDERAVQRPKARSASEATERRSVARAVVQAMDAATVYAIGPGTTTQAVMAELGLEGSLLGVDAVQGSALVARDVNEEGLLRLVRGQRACIIITPIGGQGYIFGRGNHQISARVIEAVGCDNIVVIATPSKLFGLRGAPLLVDTDDEAVNRALAGYRRVITGVGQEVVYPVGDRP